MGRNRPRRSTVSRRWIDSEGWMRLNGQGRSSRAGTSACARDCPRSSTSSTRTRISATTSTGWSATTTSSSAGMDRYGDVPREHVLPRRARPASRLPAANDRTLAFAARSEGRLIPFVRLDLTKADRGGRALPRPRRARDQAPSARAEVRARRRAARAGLRARGRARRPDPHPRRPRPAADRRRAGEARRRATPARS